MTALAIIFIYANAMYIFNNDSPDIARARIKSGYYHQPKKQSLGDAIPKKKSEIKKNRQPEIMSDFN